MSSLGNWGALRTVKLAVSTTNANGWHDWRMLLVWTSGRRIFFLGEKKDAMVHECERQCELQVKWWPFLSSGMKVVGAITHPPSSKKIKISLLNHITLEFSKRFHVISTVHWVELQQFFFTFQHWNHLVKWEMTGSRTQFCVIVKYKQFNYVSKIRNQYLALTIPIKIARIVLAKFMDGAKNTQSTKPQDHTQCFNLNKFSFRSSLVGLSILNLPLSMRGWDGWYGTGASRSLWLASCSTEIVHRYGYISNSCMMVTIGDIFKLDEYLFLFSKTFCVNCIKLWLKIFHGWWICLWTTRQAIW